MQRLHFAGIVDLGFAHTSVCSPPLPVVPWWVTDAEARAVLTGGGLGDVFPPRRVSTISRRGSTTKRMLSSRPSQLAQAAIAVKRIKLADTTGGTGTSSSHAAQVPSAANPLSCLLVGTRWTAPPEVWSKRIPYSPGKADAWSAGATLAFMATGVAPLFCADEAARGSVAGVREAVLAGRGFSIK